MNDTTPKQNAKLLRQSLLFLCRLISLRILHRGMVLFLLVTGVLLSLSGATQFAPYGIAIFYLLLPSFLQNAPTKHKEKENHDSPLSFLYEKYHYSPSSFFCYRIAFLLCSVLLFCWWLSLRTPLLFGGLSLPLLCLAIYLALYPLLSRILFFYFHWKLMNGGL